MTLPTSTSDQSLAAERFQWDLTDLYENDEAWRLSKESLVPRISALSRHRGILGTSATSLFEALDERGAVDRDLSRLYVYAALASDRDTRDSRFLAMRQEMSRLATNFAAESSFFDPELLGIAGERIESFLTEEPRLADYRMYLRDLMRRQLHTGSEAEEKIIADAGLMSDTAEEIFDIFSDADLPYPTVTLADGRTVRLDKASFHECRALPDRADRRNVVNTFFEQLGTFRRTFGVMLSGKVQSDLFKMRARRYRSTLAAALDEPNIPESVYGNLVEGINANLGTFHRYLRLRKRMLGVDALHYFDLYAPLGLSASRAYPIEESRKLIVAALAPLGRSYVSTIERAFEERWIDLYPSRGKRSGAYSQGGAYEVHPYMLINYNGRYEDMSTVAHELGHTMQSHLSNKTQPYATAGYPTFVAEVASTFNELLLIEHMLRTEGDPVARLALMGNSLESVKGTVFRQTQFAEFELRMHEMAERGESITGDALDELYLEITRKYYGHDDGICMVDDVVAHEWSNVPHFYRSFYVFQYATSFMASTALTEKVLAGEAGAVERYLRFLSAGGSKYPIELLSDAGVDMTTLEPLELTIRRTERILGEMEGMLAEMGR